MLPPQDLLDDATALPRPSLEALLAGTMALMTAWAAPCAQARLDREALRRRLARKVQSNLFFLQHHPDIGPALCQVIGQMHPQWATLTGSAQEAPPRPAVPECRPEPLH